MAESQQEPQICDVISAERYCFPCGLIIIDSYPFTALRLKEELYIYIAACGFRLKWTTFTFAVNSFSGSGSAVVVSN